jgi:magnesium chelatase family protein
LQRFKRVIEYLEGKKEINSILEENLEILEGKIIVLIFLYIKGQKQAKRALEIAAAGGHNILMIGSPGSGKSMLAKALPSILPKMSLNEAIEVTKIHSVCGLTLKITL